MAEIRVGDEVTVRGTVVGIDRAGSLELALGKKEPGALSWMLAIPRNYVLEHHPAPRPLEVGDRVRSHGGMRGVIMAIDSGGEPGMTKPAWVKWYPASSLRPVYETEALNILERDDAAG